MKLVSQTTCLHDSFLSGGGGAVVVVSIESLIIAPLHAIIGICKR